MEKIRFSLIFVFIALVFITPKITKAEESWVINNFASDINIEQNGLVSVKEIITVDFKNTPKHGINRNLPYAYEDNNGKKTYTSISSIEVIEDGRQAETKITRNDKNINIRIGNPDLTITGQHTYIINYEIEGVLRSFENFDELYWNATGNDWDTSIASARATVNLPVKITQSSCYEGNFGETKSCVNSIIGENSATFYSQKLFPGQGLTIAIGFEQGRIPILTSPTPPSFTGAILSPLGLISLSIMILITIFIVFYFLYKYGRDRRWQREALPGIRSDRSGIEIKEDILPIGRKEIISVEYDSPDNLRPAEIGVLMDERADTLDVSATIVDLAVRGFLTITEVPKKWALGKKDYIFKKTNNENTSLLEYEKELISGLFEHGEAVYMSDLKNSFYTKLIKVKKLLYKDVIEKKLFASNPDKTRKLYTTLGFILFAVGVSLSFKMSTTIGQISELTKSNIIFSSFSIGLVFAGILIQIFGRYMPRKTGYGRELFIRSQGYKLFVSGTEKYRSKFFENEETFEKVLPYAIVFGVTKKLANAFKEMGLEPPKMIWYHGAAVFNLAQFTQDMEGFSNTVSSAISSSPAGSGSGGGGFSGGGFGGGGGSSW